MQINGEEGNKYGKAAGTENLRLVQAGAEASRKYIPEPSG